MSDNKPFVVLACLCEKVLTESDGAVSLIRIVDQFAVGLPSPEVVERLVPHLAVTVVLGLKSNGHTGKHEVSIQLVGETKSEEPKVITVEFPQQGPLSAVNVVMQVAIGVVKNFGNKRFDVLFDGEFLTSIPFRVLQAPAPGQQTSEVSE